MMIEEQDKTIVEDSLIMKLKKIPSAIMLDIKKKYKHVNGNIYIIMEQR